MTLKIKDDFGQPVSLTPRVGLYTVRDYMGKEMPGLAILLDEAETKDPYAVLTVSFGEFISIKNSAYIDTNNCRFADQLLEQGIAEATGLTKSSGFGTYPLWVFKEEFLKEIGGEPYEEYSRAYDEYFDSVMSPEDEAEDTHMNCEDFKQAIKEIVEDEGSLSIHVSPDFQCDQSGGFPVSLCVSWEQRKAWLAPNELLLDEYQDITDVWQGCADFGIRTCCDAEDFNALLKGLGEEAYDSAYIQPEDQEEGQVINI